MKSNISILLADDHEIIRTGLKAIFSFQKDFSVCALACNGEEAVAAAVEHHPDIVLMDLMMPVVDGVQATRRIREVSPTTRIVILTTYADSVDVVRAVEAGASGAVSKDTPNVELIAYLRRVYAGERVFSPDIADMMAAEGAKNRLSERQLQILQALPRGLTNKEIATMLNISEDGVKFHLRTIFEKLQVANRSEAAAYALRNQLI